MKLGDLLAERVVRIGEDGVARSFSAIWPFGEGDALRRVDETLYEGPRGGRIALVSPDGSDPYFASPALRLQRVPWHLDLRWIAPAFAASVAVVLTTLLAWPAAGLWRRWRKTRPNLDPGERRRRLAVRLVLLVDAAVIAAVAIVATKARDYTIFDAALDPALLAIYALAWLGASGAVVVVWIAARLWRKGAGGFWARLHHVALAASALMIAFVFVTFHIAGTTLNY